MKKLVLSVAALLCLGMANVNAQVTATFGVDITDFINGGGTINQVVSIAGSFTSRGGDLADWTPSAGAMTDAGDNVWLKSISFTGSAISTDSLYWKYVKGSDWSDGDEGGSWDDNDPQTANCTKKSDNHNRKLMLPSDGTLIIASAWAKCAAVVTDVKTTLKGLQVAVGPNPTSSTLNIRFGGSAGSVIKMTAVDGRVAKSIVTQQEGDFTHSVDVSNLNAGIYYVTVVDGSRVYRTAVSIVK